MKGQYVIIDLRNMDFMKEDGKIVYYNTEEELERGIAITHVGEPKKETIEQAAKTYRNTIPNSTYGDELGFIDGAKWYEKRSFSEEEVLNFTQIILSQYKVGNTNIEQLDLLKETLQQFKKKQNEK